MKSRSAWLTSLKTEALLKAVLLQEWEVPQEAWAVLKAVLELDPWVLLLAWADQVDPQVVLDLQAL
jgi:hypothetical protein